MSFYEDALEQYQKAQRLSRRAGPLARREALVAKAMRRLNWHAHHRYSGKTPIYDLKNVLLKCWFHRGYLTGLRRVEQQLVCRQCGGEGWEDWDEDNRDYCRRCDGTGVWRTYHLYEMTFQVAGQREVYHIPVDLAPYLEHVPATGGEPIQGIIGGGRDISVRFAEFCYFVVWYGLPRRYRPRRLGSWQSVARAWWHETRMYNWLNAQRYGLRRFRRRLSRLWAMTDDAHRQPQQTHDDIPF